MRTILKVLLLVLPTIAQADAPTAKRWLELYRNADANGRETIRVIVQHFVDGVSWADSYNEAEGRSVAVIFCPPSKIDLKGDQLLDILRRQVEAEPEGMSPWQFAMVEALREVFPCKH